MPPVKTAKKYEIFMSENRNQHSSKLENRPPPLNSGNYNQ